MEPGAPFELQDLLRVLIPAASGIAILVLCGACAAWVVNDAQKRGRSGAVLIFMVFLCAPLVALIWLIIRPRTMLADHPVHDYANADDALTAASKLDMLGDWDEAIALYQYTAARWPEHECYVQECIKVIEGKRDHH
jgi:hypothetical protein